MSKESAKCEDKPSFWQERAGCDLVPTVFVGRLLNMSRSRKNRRTGATSFSSFLSDKPAKQIFAKNCSQQSPKTHHNKIAQNKPDEKYACPAMKG